MKAVAIWMFYCSRQVHILKALYGTRALLFYLQDVYFTLSTGTQLCSA